MFAISARYVALIKSHQERIADLREQRSAERRANEENRRIIRLPEVAVGVLREHLARQVEHMQHLGDLYRDEGLLFASEVGTPINSSNLRKRSFARPLKRANLPQIRFHDLRHTCATLLLSRNVHPKIVSEMLGHSSISITLKQFAAWLTHHRSTGARPSLRSDTQAFMSPRFAWVNIIANRCRHLQPRATYHAAERHLRSRRYPWVRTGW